MEEEQKPEETPVKEAPVEETAAPVEETAEKKEEMEEAVTPEEKEEAEEEEVKKEEKSAEDMIRDIINFINVKKDEEVEGATHRIEADTAAELVAKLEELAKEVGEIA